MEKHVEKHVEERVEKHVEKHVEERSEQRVEEHVKAHVESCAEERGGTDGTAEGMQDSVVCRGVRVAIDVAAYENNIRILRQLTAPARLCAVLKADGYGHGLHRLAAAALRGGAQAVGIAENWEAARLRAIGIACPILRLRPAVVEEVAEATRWGVEEVVGCWEDAQALSRLAQKLGHEVPVHLEVDVGMGRTGFWPSGSDTHRLLDCCRLPGLGVRGVMTHFPCADADLAISQTHLERFARLLQSEPAASVVQRPHVLVHAANSAAALRLPESRFGMVRMGIATYGIAPSPDTPLPEGVKPVMSWHTRVISVRDVPAGSTIGYGMTFCAARPMRIATLPVGYADGWWRRIAESGTAAVLIGGQRCPVVGRVSMNMVTVDVTSVTSATSSTSPTSATSTTSATSSMPATPVPPVQPGDVATLVGAQGGACIRMEDLAAQAGTIGYELCCAIGSAAR